MSENLIVLQNLVLFYCETSSQLSFQIWNTFFLNLVEFLNSLISDS